jgi:hypothetical protein
MLVNLTAVSLESKMRLMTREENSAVLMIHQNDCVRTVEHGNELALMSPSTDPTSFCFFIAERVDLAKPDGLGNPPPPLARKEAVVNLVTWDDAMSEPFGVSGNGAEGGGCIARGIPLGISTLGA